MKTTPPPKSDHNSRRADELFTAQQICDKLKISKQSLRRLRKSGRIGCYRIFNNFRYDFEEVKAAMTRPVDRKPGF